MKTPIKSKLNQAFSLVELLVVIAVIAIIAAIAIPNIVGIREGASGAQLEVDARTADRLAAAAYMASGTKPTIAALISPGISATIGGSNVNFQLQTTNSAANVAAKMVQLGLTNNYQ